MAEIPDLDNTLNLISIYLARFIWKYKRVCFYHRLISDMKFFEATERSEDPLKDLYLLKHHF